MAMSATTAYQKTIDYLFGLQKHGVKLGLSNSIRLMDLMGNPHRAFPAVHIAGTNGKGSTAAYLAAILRTAGYRVGLYTSPHLISFTERMRINGTPVTEAKVVELAQHLRERLQRACAPAEPAPPTFFEVTTAMAFTWFAEEGVDIAVIEAGMGGRLDSTNVITPLVSVITNIDLEHTDYLGETLELIAGEKAGIIKQGVPVVSGAMQPGVAEVFEQTAAHQAKLYRLHRNFAPKSVRGEGTQVFDYEGIAASYAALEISMQGRYQVDNACLAVAAIECLRIAGIAVDEPSLRQGLARTCWEGRLERVAVRPDIFLDGAHNPASAAMLAAAVMDMKRRYKRLVLVIGILGDKDVPGILDALVPLADQVIATKPQYSRALDVEALATRVRTIHGSVATAQTVEEAISLARNAAVPEDLVLITGSLYVVGDARAVLVGPDHSALKGLKG